MRGQGTWDAIVSATEREVASVHFVEGQLERACLQLSEGGRSAVCGPASESSRGRSCSVCRLG